MSLEKLSKILIIFDDCMILMQKILSSSPQEKTTKNKIKNLVVFCAESLLISLLSAYLIWLQTSKYGLGLRPDSIRYLKWADAISKEGFRFVINNNSAICPPFYPLLLSFVSTLFHVNILVAARWFNIVLAFVFSFSAMVLCRKVTKNPLLLFTAGVFIVFAKPINFVFSLAGSEPLFIFLILLITFSLEKVSYKCLMLCGLLTSMAILTRYAGVSIVPAVCLYIFIQKSGMPEKIKKCFAYSLIPTLTYIMYLARNYYFTQTLMGTRHPSKTGLISNCDRAFSTIIGWLFDRQQPYNFIGFAVLLIIGAFIWNYRYELRQYFFKLPEIIKFSACYCLIYFVFITVSSTTTAYDLINDRLMLPVFPSVLLSVLCFVVFCCTLQDKNKFLVLGMLAVSIYCLVTFSLKTLQDVNFRKNNGAGGYASVFWQENKLLNYFKENDLILSETIYTNNPWAFYLVDKKLQTNLIPEKKYYNSIESTGITLENLTDKITDFEKSYLAYFKFGCASDFFTLAELQSVCRMETVIETADGNLYKVGKCK